MTGFEGKVDLLQRLCRSIVARFGDGAFVSDDPAMFGENHVCLHSVEDPRVSFSIIAQDERLFSLQVEGEWPEMKNTFMPVEILCTEDGASMERVLDLLEKHRTWEA